MKYVSIKLSILSLALAAPIAFAGNLSHLSQVAGQTKHARMMAAKDAETAKKEYDNMPGIKVAIQGIDSYIFEISGNVFIFKTYEINNNDSLYEKLHGDFFNSEPAYLNFPYLFSHRDNSDTDNSRTYIEFKVSDKAIFELDGKSIPVSQILATNKTVHYKTIAILDYKNHVSETILDAGVVEVRDGNIKIIEN